MLGHSINHVEALGVVDRRANIECLAAVEVP